MAEKLYSILQSGFITYVNAPLTKPESTSESSMLQLIKIGKPSRASENLFFYSNPVAELFTQYCSNNNMLKDFDFREQLLTVALDLLNFEGRAFSSWIYIQKCSPKLTAMHKRFLMDTLNYISTGKREIEIDSWGSMLTMRKLNDADRKAAFAPEALFDKPESNTVCGSSLPNMSVDVLVKWTAQPKGFRDLMVFLNIVFGRKLASMV